MATFSQTLVDTLRRSLRDAHQRRHEYITLEHLLLGLVDDHDASEVMLACKADIKKLRQSLERYMKTELESLVVAQGQEIEEPRPTAGFQRVLQRAMLHVDSSGGKEVTGANVLVALFSERESHAAFFLQEQEMTRFDAVNFIAHGLSRGQSKPTQTAAIDTQELLSALQKRNAELDQQLSMAIARINDLEKAVAAAKVGIPSGARREEHDVFVSYRREQKELVRRLVDRLRLDGIVVWWDADLPPQAPWEETIEKHISNSKVVIVCWSHEALKGENVKAEARHGKVRNRLIQIFLDDCHPPMFFGERQGIQFGHWSGDVADECYRHLVEGIRVQL